jgi:hypothetical protein
MKIFCLVLLSAFFVGGIAQAYPTADQYDLNCSSDSSLTREFRTSATCTAAGGAWYTACPAHNRYYAWEPMGYNVSYTSICCVREPLAAEVGGSQSERELRPVQTAHDVDLRLAFEAQQEGLTEVYYGYYYTSALSPSTGRSREVDAKLDVCVGHSNSDSWSDTTSCQTGCGTTANAHCTATGSNNGQSNVWGAVCMDRCECKYGGTCDGL